MTAGAGERVSDADLAARFRRDPELFTEVHDRYFPAIYRYVAGRMDKQTAEDIAAETFLVAFDRRNAFDAERGSLQSWLFGIATNLVARHHRKEARHYRALARIDVAPADEGHENRVVASVAAQRLLPQLAKALSRLSSSASRVPNQAPQLRGGGRRAQHLPWHGRLPAQPCAQEAESHPQFGGTR